MTDTERPLSPHIQIYRWQWTMTYSILHRATGLVLFIGLSVLALWCVALAFFPVWFDNLEMLLLHPLGLFALWLWLWTLLYHLCNGIRHLLWDGGFLFSLPWAAWSGHAAFSVSVLAAIGLFWLHGI